MSREILKENGVRPPSGKARITKAYSHGWILQLPKPNGGLMTTRADSWPEALEMLDLWISGMRAVVRQNLREAFQMEIR